MASTKISAAKRFMGRAVNKILIMSIRAAWFLTFGLCAALLFTSLDTYLRAREFVYLATLSVPTLAILFGFTALLYNRARAYQYGPTRRRSLYAAERSLQATLLFAMAVGTATVLSATVWHFDITQPENPRNALMQVIFLVPIMLTLFSFASFYFAIRAIAHTVARPVQIRHLVRQIRKDK